MDLADGNRGSFELVALPWIKPVNQCYVALRRTAKNRGCMTPRRGKPFAINHNREGWLEVADKIQPFIAGSYGYQWLTCEGEVNILLSQDGGW
jgi:hypothetical protein